MENNTKELQLQKKYFSRFLLKTPFLKVFKVFQVCCDFSRFSRLSGNPTVTV